MSGEIIQREIDRLESNIDGIANLVISSTNNRRSYRKWEIEVMKLCGYEIEKGIYCQFTKKEGVL